MSMMYVSQSFRSFPSFSFSSFLSLFLDVSQTCWPGVCHIEGWLCCWYVAARCCTYSLYRMPFVQIVSVHRIRSFCFRNWWMVDIMHNTTEFIFVNFIFLRTGRSYKTGNCMYFRRRVSHWRNLCYNWLTRYDYSPKKKYFVFAGSPMHTLRRITGSSTTFTSPVICCSTWNCLALWSINIYTNTEMSLSLKQANLQ